MEGLESHLRNLYFSIVYEESLQTFKKGWDIKRGVA